MPRNKDSSDSQEAPFFAGRYQILQTIGEGGAGVVYKAYDSRLARTLAIKTLRFSPDKPNRVLRFQREARAASKLKHPGLVQIFDFGITDDGTPYLVMEFIEGHNLQDVLEERGRLGVVEALQITYLVSRAMEHAHAHRVIHRDLKPSNILLKESESGTELKIVDFGLAAHLEPESLPRTLTPTHAIAGSPNYMSPEQIKHGDIDGRSDIYSLGCILFELLCGQAPFASDNALETLDKQVHCPPPALDDFGAAAIPLSLRVMLEKMLAKDVLQRMNCMTSVKEACLETIEELGNLQAPKAPAQAEPGSSGLFLSLGAAIDNARELDRSRLSKARRAGIISGIAIVLVIMAAVYLKNSERQSGEDKSTERAVRNSPADIDKDSSETLDAMSVSHVEGQNAHANKLWSEDPAFGDKEAIEAISNNCNLTEIELTGTSITDRTMKEMARLKRLQILDIQGSPLVTDGGLQYLTALPLHSLALARTGITDNGLTHVARIKTLEGLIIDHTNVSENGIKHLIGLPALRLISISGTKMSGKNILVLRALKHLTWLKLSRTNISDNDMHYFASVEQIQHVWIQDSRVSDKGLACLAQLPRLKYVWITRSRGFSDMTLTYLKRKTGCRVEVSDL